MGNIHTDGLIVDLIGQERGGMGEGRGREGKRRRGRLEEGRGRGGGREKKKVYLSFPRG